MVIYGAPSFCISFSNSFGLASVHPPHRVCRLRRKLTNDETITLKYYSAARQYVYRSAFQFTFNAQTAFGAENTHREVKFIIED